MKLAMLKKIYPYLNNNLKHHKWRKLTNAELDSLMAEKQIVSNCYDVAVRYSLLNSNKGREFLKKNLKVSKNLNDINACKITFNIKNQKKSYKTISDGSKTLGEMITSTVGKMIKNNPLQKPWISRLGRFGFSKSYEFNKPSNAFHWYTGKQTISIGENDLNLSLKKRKEDVINLLNKLSDQSPKDYSFVAISSWQKNKLNGKKIFHCLPIIGVNKDKKTLQIINKRTDEIINVKFEDFIHKFKAIVGINHK